MKKAFTFVFTLLMVAVCQPILALDHICLIQGKLTYNQANSMHLFQVHEGRRIEIAQSKVSEAQQFAFAVPDAKEGFYYISDQNKRSFTRLYLKKQDFTELIIHSDKYELVKGSKENKVLFQWYNLIYPIYYPSIQWMRVNNSTYLTYFPTFEKTAPKAMAFKQQINTPNKNFNSLMKLAADVDIEFTAMNFLLTPKSVHPTKDQYPAYYQTIITPNKFSDYRLMELGECFDYMSRYMAYNVLMGKIDMKNMDRMAAQTQMITNDTLKGVFLSQSMNFKSFDELEKQMPLLSKYLVTDSMDAIYKRTIKSLANFKKGSPSFAFAFEDPNGKKITNANLKGKVMLVDIWATWCGPCKEQIPHLKKLEEDYKNKDVVFVSISVDEMKDKEKWKKMIETESLGGIQLFAGGFGDMTKYYDIHAIPRFMLFNKDGSIVSINAPRPSQEELRKLLDQTLSETK